MSIHFLSHNGQFGLCAYFIIIYLLKCRRKWRKFRKTAKKSLSSIIRNLLGLIGLNKINRQKFLLYFFSNKTRKQVHRIDLCCAFFLANFCVLLQRKIFNRKLSKFKLTTFWFGATSKELNLCLPRPNIDMKNY